MKKDHEKIWGRCLEVIKDNVSQQSFKTWFEPIKALKLDDHVLTIQVPSQFFYEWLEEHYIVLLKKIIKNFHVNTLQKNGWSSRHTYSGLLISPTPEGAKGSVYALVFNVTAKPPFVDHSGVYEDWLVKTAAGWKFKKRLFKQNGSFQPSLP